MFRITVRGCRMIGAGTNIAGVMNVGSAAFPAAARAATLPVVPAGRDVGSRRCFHLSAVSREEDDLYKILGVPKTASKKEIKKAYYQLAKDFHPDKHQGDEIMAKKFADISAAYDTLGDDSKRAAYDAGPSDPFSQGGGFGGFGGGAGSAEDIFSQFFGNRGSNSPGRGGDVQVQVTLSFSESVEGISREITYASKVSCEDCGGTGARNNSVTICPVCNGSGVENMSMGGGGFLQYQATCRKCNGVGTVIRDPCGNCSGRGTVKKQRTVSVDIPAGVADGMDIRVPGQGQSGLKGGPPGNLYIRVRVAPDKRFTRQEDDVHSEAVISLAQAVFGGTTTIEGVKGDFTLRIRPGTASGTKERIRGRGIPRVNSSGKGDHYVHYRVRIPASDKLSDKQREALMMFASMDAGENGTVLGLEEFRESQSQSKLMEPDDSDAEINGRLTTDCPASSNTTMEESIDEDKSVEDEKESGSFFDGLFGSGKTKSGDEKKKS